MLYLFPIAVVLKVWTVFVVVARQAAVGCQPRCFDALISNVFTAGAMATFAANVNSVHGCFSIDESAIAAKADCVASLA